MQTERLTKRIFEQAPFASEAEAEAAALATLRALGEYLLEDERNWLLASLPEQFAQALGQPESATEGARANPPNKRNFLKRVAAHEGARQGLATEHAEVVCRALAECLPEETVARLKKHLPELAELFELPEPTEAPAAPIHSRAPAPHSLAEGRPGSTHPLASGDPNTLAHEHSVARSDDPHAATKLSSARGTRQESQGRTLATGQPGSRRKLSDSS